MADKNTACCIRLKAFYYFKKSHEIKKNHNAVKCFTKKGTSKTKKRFQTKIRQLLVIKSDL